MMQMQIPSGLQALMQASQVLQEESSPVVQTPMGPKPTVAGMVAQGLQQAAAQKMPQQPMMARQPDVRGMGQQAGIAGQIQNQQMARQQQMAQDPQAIAQMAAQMLQKPEGISGLPVNMQFKEGGIIGFAGEERSDVPKPEVSQSEFETLKDQLDQAQRQLAAATKSGDLNAVRMYAAPVQQLQQRLSQVQGAMSLEPAARPSEARSELDFLTEGIQEPTVPPKTIRTGPKPEAIAQGQAPMGIAQPSRLGDRRPEPSRYMEPAAPAAPRAPVTTTAPARPSAPRGVADLLPTDLKAPTTASVIEEAKRLLPDDVAPYEARMREIAKQREAKIKGMPDLAQEGITAIQRSAEEREALRAKQAEGDMIGRTRAFFQSLGSRGDSYETFEKGVQAREEANRVAKLNEAQAILKLREAQQARALGEFDRAEALEKEIMGHREKARTAMTQMAQVTGQLASSVYGNQMQFINQRLTDAAREREKAQELSMRMKELKTTKDGQQLVAAQGRVTEALKAWESVNDKHKIAASLTPDMMKDPNFKAMYDRFIAEKETVWNNTVAPAIRNRDRLEEQITGVKPTTAPAGGGAPVTVKAPNGTTYTFPNQEAADNFKRQAGIK